MRTVFRDIVGGFIFSHDNKVLLGKNRQGGVYEGYYVVPGGGIDEGETKEEALIREMQEETGIDIRAGTIEEINIANGEHEKTLRETGERVLVRMTFYDYKITLPLNATEIIVTAEDDWNQPQWFSGAQVNETFASIGFPTAQTLRKIGFLERSR